MNEFDDYKFDYYKWLDELAMLEKSQDMHNSLYFDPESQYEIFN